MRTIVVLAIFLLAFSTFGQQLPSCRDPQGKAVDWFLVYYTPGKVHSHAPLYGYMYMDSNSDSDQFQFKKGWGDEPNGPIGRTIAQVKQHRLESVAWNDQLYAHQGVGNSNRAHSKFFMALKGRANGFAISHSTPKFPTINDDGEYTEPVIDKAQKDKAQHFLCMTIRGDNQVKELIQGSCFINPNIYHNGLEVNCGASLDDKDPFHFSDFNIGKSVFRAVFKNGYINKRHDIFVEGILPIVESDIVIETFGAPRAFDPYCQGDHTVGNTNQIVLSEGVKWTQWHDHSKWGYAIDNDFVCFGDLNRNTIKQELRGGAFYCIDNQNLNTALKKINPEHSGC